MKFAAIHRAVMQRQPAITADDATIGAWVRLMVHAADLEIGEGDGDFGEGRIPGCKTWSDREMLRAVGTDLEGVSKVVEAGLARWNRDDLLVLGYDLKGQKRASANRKNGTNPPALGKKRGRPKKKPMGFSSENPAQTQAPPTDKPSENPSPLLSSPLPSSPPAYAGTRACARDGGEVSPWLRVAKRYKLKFEAMRNAPWTSHAKHQRSFEDIAGWVTAEADRSGDSWDDVADALIALFFAARDPAKSDWHPSWLADNPARYYRPPKAGVRNAAPTAEEFEEFEDDPLPGEHAHA